MGTRRYEATPAVTPPVARATACVVTTETSNRGSLFPHFLVCRRFPIVHETILRSRRNHFRRQRKRRETDARQHRAPSIKRGISHGQHHSPGCNNRRNRLDLHGRLCRALQKPEPCRRATERKARAERQAGSGRTAETGRPRGADQTVGPGRKNHKAPKAQAKSFHRSPHHLRTASAWYLLVGFEREKAAA